MAKLAARCGHTRLSTLGVEEGQLEPVAVAVEQHPLLANTPGAAGREPSSLTVLHEAL